MARTVQKVRISKCDMGRAFLDEAANIVKHGCFGHQHEPSFVDGDNRAVTAVVQASPAGLDVSNEALLAVVLQFGVAGERTQCPTIGKRNDRG